MDSPLSVDVEPVETWADRASETCTKPSWTQFMLCHFENVKKKKNLVLSNTNSSLILWH